MFQRSIISLIFISLCPRFFLSILILLILFFNLLYLLISKDCYRFIVTNAIIYYIRYGPSVFIINLGFPSYTELWSFLQFIIRIFPKLILILINISRYVWYEAYTNCSDQNCNKDYKENNMPFPFFLIRSIWRCSLFIFFPISLKYYKFIIHLLIP